ncbi:hypothetical protein CPB84DRAFT_1789663 [Gymnopilus junonius]|uniref:Uncharacterized protein n=1 Tax=Gymnopilus junonius TaxID=109634 RepID=A0A9P5NEM1_GYMJU|nr:hypothetical protein CPB84DRAFT_1789663 [Gymnopilus junonius]
MVERHRLVTKRNILTWRSWITVLHVGAIISSFFRLYRQRKVSKLWLDDYFAALALAAEFVLFPALWLLGVAVYHKVHVSREVVISQIVASWIVNSVFWILLWSTRISFALSTARFTPPGTFLYKSAIALSGIFFGILVACTSYMTVKRAKMYSIWSKEAPYQCILPSWIPELLTFDFFADISLVIIPACAFWGGLKLDYTARRLIQACFAATSLTAAWNIIYTSHSTCTGSCNSLMLIIFQPYILGPISLLVCNMLIVVTSLYRLFRDESKPVVAMPSASNVAPGPLPNNEELQGSAHTISPLTHPNRSGRQESNWTESPNQLDLTVPSTAWTDLNTPEDIEMQTRHSRP